MKEDLKSLLSKLKAYFAETPPAENPPAELVDVKAKDGKTYKVAKLEVGEVLQNEDGSPAAEGTIELEDGSSLVIDAEGKITEVKPAVPEAKPAENPPADPAQFSQMTPEQFNGYMQSFASGTPEERIGNLEVICRALMSYNFGYRIKEAEEKATIEAAIAAYQKSMEPAQAAVKEQMSAMFKAIEILSEQPEAKPTGEKKHSSFKVDKSGVKEKVAEAFKSVGK